MSTEARPIGHWLDGETARRSSPDRPTDGQACPWVSQMLKRHLHQVRPGPLPCA